MAIHPGDANTRLASEIDQILVLWPSDIPAQYKVRFDELVELIQSSSEAAQLIGVGLRPSKIGRIQNRTAAKYIKLLIDIENELAIQIED